MKKLLLSFGSLIVISFVASLSYIFFASPTPLTKQGRPFLIAKKPKYDAPEMHALIERQRRTSWGDDEPKYKDGYVFKEYKKAKVGQLKRKRQGIIPASTDNGFVERGPGNVAGRTRGLLLDPDDTSGNTIFAGSASGGVWKTTNGGDDWEYISSDIPNLGTNTLAMSKANTNVIYAGTGEFFTRDIDGAGMFKSTDKGQSWQQIASPDDYPSFKNVSRIVVDPNDENIVIATTRNSVWASSLSSSIFKTTDGGATWTELLNSGTADSDLSGRYDDDIDYDPTDFNTLYVALNGKGVIKSTDGGQTWSDASEGMQPSGRVEITISPVDSSVIWASVQGNVTGTGSDMYISENGGETWAVLFNSSGTELNFLGGQGWYDNIVTPHPFDKSIVYVGGVNTFKFEFSDGEVTSTILEVTEDGTDSFMDYVNFGGPYLRGGLSTFDFPIADVRDVEVRFGEGTQKAHRFTAQGQGAVSFSSFTYEDYIDVPFQVWDTENNVQLMVSFRDQQEDGAWDLIPFNISNGSDDSREYLVIHDLVYSENADANIVQDGGFEHEMMYFSWPVLADGANFDAGNLPSSKLILEKVERTDRVYEGTVVSDAYNQFTGVNRFAQSVRSIGLHPDQHNVLIYDVDEDNETFRLLIGNDGGVYKSVSSTDPGVTNGDFTYISYGYNTTQFYGADKAPGENRFVGGMQDNGTWYHAQGVEGTSSADATFGIGGDGFEGTMA